MKPVGMDLGNENSNCVVPPVAPGRNRLTRTHGGGSAESRCKVDHHHRAGTWRTFPKGHHVVLDTE